MNKIRLRIPGISLLMICLLNLSSTSFEPKNAEFKLGVQAYTFHKFTFVETLKKINQLNLKYVEVYFGQKLGEGFDGTMDYRMDAQMRKSLLRLARSKGIKIFACGVVTCRDEDEWSKVFEFASAMKIKIITCEPQAEHLDLVEQLADKHRIDVAIHNHPKPSSYWHPDAVMKAIEGRNERFGGCADIGHWKRMGIEPLDGLRRYHGRIKCIHIKDVSSGDPEAQDVIWGQGACDLPAILNEIHLQDFSGLLSIEYESNWDNSVPDIEKCIEFYEQQIHELKKQI
jgi:sugar phosphate isomerase/epimerase